MTNLICFIMTKQSKKKKIGEINTHNREKMKF